MIHGQVQRIERTALLLVGAAILVSVLFWDLRIIFGVAVGGGLAVLNFYALRRIVQAIVAGSNPRKQVLLVVLLTAKFGFLAAVIYLAIKLLPVNPYALLIGISVVVLSIFVEGFRSMLSGAAAESE